MANEKLYAVPESQLIDIADAIRSKGGTSSLISIPDMKSAIEAISGGGAFDLESSVDWSDITPNDLSRGSAHDYKNPPAEFDWIRFTDTQNNRFVIPTCVLNQIDPEELLILYNSSNGWNSIIKAVTMTNFYYVSRNEREIKKIECGVNKNGETVIPEKAVQSQNVLMTFSDNINNYNYIFGLYAQSGYYRVLTPPQKCDINSNPVAVFRRGESNTAFRIFTNQTTLDPNTMRADYDIYADTKIWGLKIK